MTPIGDPMTEPAFLWTCPTCKREKPQDHIQRVAGLWRAWWHCRDGHDYEVHTELVRRTA